MTTIGALDIIREYQVAPDWVEPLTSNPLFPIPVQTGEHPAWDAEQVAKFFNEQQPRRSRRDHPLYTPNGRHRKRPYPAGVKVTSNEKTYYIEKYGSLTAALRHLINEDQRRRYEEN